MHKSHTFARFGGDHGRQLYTQFFCGDWFLSLNPWPITFDVVLIYSYQMHKSHTFARSGRNHGRQPYTQFFVEANFQVWIHDLALFLVGDTCHRTKAWPLIMLFYQKRKEKIADYAVTYN